MAKTRIITNKHAPALAAILWTPDCYETIRRTIAALRAQTVCEKIELVLLGPSPGSLEGDPSDIEGFAACRRVVLDGIGKSSIIRAAGVRAATAPIVAFMQDHAFPIPGWAEALLTRYEGPWSGVSFVFENDNPDTATSWANFLMQYGAWTTPLPKGPVRHIGGHMASYRREVLMAYGDALPRKLETSIAMHWEMIGQGHRFTTAPGAVVYHQNHSRFLPSLELRFQTGRLFAANRVRSWSFLRRLAYAAATPLIPPLRLYRVLRDALRTGQTRLLPRLAVVSLVLLLWDAAGQAVGALAGSGKAMEWITGIEWHRHRFMVEGEVSAFLKTSVHDGVESR
ncbi:MAG: glycosyltransferase [Xanthomonadales bacterium]|jgi:hypothetical protein|nr:glycosyltransferase [Xanthomonadales bacterium]